MKIVIITDTHAGMRNDNKSLRTKQQQFYENIFFPYIDEHDIKTVLHLGDMFDRRKYINFDTLAWWNKTFMDQLSSRSIELHTIAGNHDCYYKSTNDINSLNQLYGGSAYQNSHFYWTEPVELTFDSLKIIMCPWLAPDNQQQSLEKVANSDARILMGHLEINGFPLMKGHLCDHGLDVNLFSRFHAVYSGHFHTQSKNRNVHYLGTPYQMTWNDYGDTKGFHVLDTETMNLEFVANPYDSFIKIKYEDSDLKLEDINALDTSNMQDAFVKLIIINKTNPFLFDLFVERLNNSGAADVKVVDDNKYMDELTDEDLLNETESTETILQKYIDGIETQVDKVKLQQFMINLYNESLTV